MVTLLFIAPRIQLNPKKVDGSGREPQAARDLIQPESVPVRVGPGRFLFLAGGALWRHGSRSLHTDQAAVGAGCVLQIIAPAPLQNASAI